VGGVKGHNKNEISFPGSPGPLAGKLHKSSPYNYDTTSLGGGKGQGDQLVGAAHRGRPIREPQRGSPTIILGKKDRVRRPRKKGLTE